MTTQTSNKNNNLRPSIEFAYEVNANWLFYGRLMKVKQVVKDWKGVTFNDYSFLHSSKPPCEAIDDLGLKLSDLNLINKVDSISYELTECESIKIYAKIFDHSNDIIFREVNAVVSIKDALLSLKQHRCYLKKHGKHYRCMQVRINEENILKSKMFFDKNSNYPLTINADNFLSKINKSDLNEIVRKAAIRNPNSIVFI